MLDVVMRGKDFRDMAVNCQCTYTAGGASDMLEGGEVAAGKGALLGVVTRSQNKYLNTWVALKERCEGGMRNVHVQCYKPIEYIGCWEDTNRFQ